MTAFFIATSRIKNPQKFAEYGAAVGATIAAFEGQLVIRGMAVDVLAGTSDQQGVGVASFADMETLKAWYASPEYQALIPLRDEAAEITLVTYQVPE